MKDIIMYYEGRNCSLSFKEKLYFFNNAQTTLKGNLEILAHLAVISRHLSEVNLNNFVA